MTSRVIFAVSALALVLGTASCSQLAVAAATVNGEKITESEVEAELDTLRDDPVFGEALKRDPDTRGQRRREILRELIYQLVAQQEAERLGVRVTRGQVDALIDQTARSRGQSVDELLEAENLTMSDARRLAERGVRRFALIDEVIDDVDVPDDAVRDVYEGQQERFTEVHLERITVRTESEARRIVEDVQDGARFSDLAEERSTDDLASEGGDMGVVPVTALDIQVQNAVSSAVVGGLTAPLQGQNGYEIYRLVDRRKKEFEEVEAEIERALSQEDRDLRYQQWLAGRVRDARIVVNPKYGRFDKRQDEPTVVPSGRELPE
jgi:parvulin-like peptidyl-prolyl isomerase